MRGFGGLPPARSALTLRLILAAFGLVVCAGAATLFALAGASYGVVAFFAVLAAIAVVDLAVIIRRRSAGTSGRRGEPG
jgi:membrane protein implicated in regulation of membrane protease activity